MDYGDIGFGPNFSPSAGTRIDHTRFGECDPHLCTSISLVTHLIRALALGKEVYGALS